MLLASTLAAIGIGLGITTAWFVTRPRPLTDTQIVLQNALDWLTLNPTLHHKEGGFMPCDTNFIHDLTLPHCVLAIVAAHDPDYARGRIYGLASVDHVDATAWAVFGMSAAKVNDTLGYEWSLDLLRYAIKGAA